ncbi:hypothetical protein Tco_1362685 [Tanacetum coccineum]
MNKTLIEAARTMLADSLLPTTFWAEAVSTACYVFNRASWTKEKSSTSSKAQEFLTELQNLKTQEKEAYSTGISGQSPEIHKLFRRELDDLAQKHLREVPKNKATKLTIFNNLSKGFLIEASYDVRVMVHDFNTYTTEVADLVPFLLFGNYNIHPQSQILAILKATVQTQKQSEANFRSTMHLQEEGIDYDEVFAPMARIEAIRGVSLSTPGFVDPDHLRRFIRFQMSSMGELIFFLGLQVKQKTDGIFISQDKRDDVDVTPKTSHLNAMKRIFKYLKGKPNLGLWYPRESSFDLEAFSDSDYVGANLDRKSTTGGCQFLGRRLISWQCKKQTIVATSTTEAKYVAAVSCCGQVLWIQNQMSEIGNISKERNVVLTTSEDEEPEDQGRIFKDIDDDPLVSFVTPTKPSGEAQEEEISPTTLEAAKTLSKVASQKSKSVDKGAKGKGKPQMIVEETQAPKRTKEQIQQEEASLAEAIRLQNLEEEETAKQVHLDALLAKRLAEEEENQGTWKLSQFKKLKFEEIKEEFNKLVKQVDTFVPMSLKAIKAELKRFGEELQTKTTKRQKIDDKDAPIIEERKKAIKEDDSSSGTNVPINHVPVAIKSPSIASYKIIKQGKKGVYQIVRENGTDKVYMSLGAMLKEISREDLTELYRIVMKRYGTEGPTDDYERVFWENLKTMFDAPLSTDLLKKNIPYQLVMSNYADNEALDGKDE